MLHAASSQRAALAEAQEGLDIVMAQLKDAKARLAGVQNRLAELEKGFDDAVAKKQVRNDPHTEFASMLPAFFVPPFVAFGQLHVSVRVSGLRVSS